ncbi:NAD(P)/FAD-dependent oxidoreductase [Streptomyces sp. NPDC091412]|uniref:NAD(P)/FAD-dependent oxidoreductase n=1 Tax=Streptomyces sp. NPDC091412 TaxID=3366002 RepID=UPI00380431D7
MQHFDVLIVGAGHAGVALVGQLAKSGYDGSVGILDSQDCPPYERPPLSKGYMLGEVRDDDLPLRREDYWSKGTARLVTGTTVTQVDPGARTVTTDSGEKFGYTHLVWATGASARLLSMPGADAENVLSVRTLEDARRLRALATDAQRAVLIGGGYIGLETAATLAKLGKQVTVVELQERLLARVAGATIAEHLRRVHEDHGVRVVLGTGVSELGTTDGVVTSVTLTDGQTLPTDILIVGIGVEPLVAPLVAAGATTGNGVLVDARCRTSLPNVHAIGDIAAQPNEFAGDTVMRLESVPNTTEHARVVAADLSGAEPPQRGVPWFWSNQYDVRLQTAGILTGFDHEVPRHQDDGSLVVGYFKDGRLIAADCVDAPRDFSIVKALLAASGAVTAEEFADTSAPLSTLVKRGRAAVS